MKNVTNKVAEATKDLVESKTADFKFNGRIRIFF